MRRKFISAAKRVPSKIIPDRRPLHYVAWLPRLETGSEVDYYWQISDSDRFWFNRSGLILVHAGDALCRNEF